MRRLLPALLILGPFLLALLYAWLYRVAAPTPTLETVVPKRAIYVQRYRDVEALDETFFRHPDDPTSPAERIAETLNIPGFPGLDRRRPIHLVFLPRGARPDSTMFILPLVREEALRARFEDPDFFLERGHVRYAKHLAVRGDFAAIGGDPDAVEHLGEGGLTAEPLGETFAIAVDVPALVEYAAQVPWEEPWASILGAYGVGPDAIEARDGAVIVTSDALTRIRGAWRTARLWSFVEEGRLRIELEPAPGPLADALAALARAPATPPSPDLAPVPRAQAWIQLPGAVERALFARALYDAGLTYPSTAPGAGDGPGSWADPRQGGGLLLWASAAVGHGYAWTIGVAGPRGALSDVAAFLPGRPALGGGEAGLAADIPVAEGVLPLTVADLGLDRTSPPGRIVAWSTPSLDVVLVGPDPEQARADLERGLAEAATRAGPAAPEAPWRRVARFGLSAARAKSLLGKELQRGGLLAGLASGAIQGEVTTDGRVLRLEATVDRGLR